MLEKRFDPATVSELRMCWARGDSHGSSKCSATTSKSGQTARSGNQGSALGSVPEASANAAEISVPGNGKLTFAHTPSWAPGRAPRWPDSRCVSQRSIPCVGTETTSGTIGSASGTPTSSASFATRVSARSERWAWSTPAEYVAGALAPPWDASGGVAGVGAALGQPHDGRLGLVALVALVEELQRLQVARRHLDWCELLDLW